MTIEHINRIDTVFSPHVANPLRHGVSDGDIR
jgi:hypothetical protein